MVDPTGVGGCEDDRSMSEMTTVNNPSRSCRLNNDFCFITYIYKYSVIFLLFLFLFSLLCTIVWHRQLSLNTYDAKIVKVEKNYEHDPRCFSSAVSSRVRVHFQRARADRVALSL